jgi:hypothetical protein
VPRCRRSNTTTCRAWRPISPGEEVALASALQKELDALADLIELCKNRGDFSVRASATSCNVCAASQPSMRSRTPRGGQPKLDWRFLLRFNETGCQAVEERWGEFSGPASGLYL